MGSEDMNGQFDLVVSDTAHRPADRAQHGVVFSVRVPEAHVLA